MATQIKTLSLSRLTLAAHSQFHKLVISKIESYGAADLHIEQLAPLYAVAAAEEMVVINRPTAFSETPMMEATNHERDKTIYSIIYAHVRRGLYHKWDSRESVLLQGIQC